MLFGMSCCWLID